jgi:integral membrane sensor domain MASE1
MLVELPQHCLQMSCQRHNQANAQLGCTHRTALAPLRLALMHDSQMSLLSSSESEALSQQHSLPPFHLGMSFCTSRQYSLTSGHHGCCPTHLQANLDNSNRAYWPIQVVNRWLSVRLEMMGAFIVFLTATCVTVIMPSNPGGSLD